MARHVKCKMCGKSFEKKGFVYRDGTRYVCWSCGREHNRNVKKYQREYKKLQRMIDRGMVQTYPVMIAKIIIGLSLFAVTPFGFILGIMILANAIVPFVKRKKTREYYSNIL